MAKLPLKPNLALDDAVPLATTVGGAAGAGKYAANSRHQHPTEVGAALSTDPATTAAFGDVADDGAGTEAAKDTHVHGMPDLIGNLAELGQVISNPPTQAEVQALSDGFDALLAALKAAAHMEADA
jgi:hypothetical protein